MKLGLISDIHADYKALVRVIRLLETQHQVDAIWCAGDLVGRGKQPDAVVERIVAGGIPTVMGNHDEMVLTPHSQQNGQRRTLGEALGYRSETLRLLHTLPRTYRALLDGQRVVMVHGTPLDNNRGISINPQNRQQSIAWLNKISADILIAGHTHTPMLLKNQHGMIVNPGSLFDPTGHWRSSSETYGVLDISTREFSYFPVWS